ncbi:SAFB-like transcription modulator isoform X1 [Schistocerca piceifrons]|uniref:SAFB-like transcription modulator isoform X1 n=2 Tax=Schistocerca piceifrons TaxID=274613 RepID=UPI001F5EE75E|nr:SAFB-like transcription modulator isoform X1 [Schistocerca piceifrons]
MASQTPKRRRQKYCSIICDENTRVTRSLLKKLVRAKHTPEIYKEVVRSQRRKGKLFRAPDIHFRSSCKGSEERTEEQLNEDISQVSEETLLDYDCRSLSWDNLNEDSPEDIGEEDRDDCVRKTSFSNAHELGKQHSVLPSVYPSSESDLQWQSEAYSDLEDIAEEMSQKTNKSRKSVSNENSVASPGVITRSQLKQLANAKSVPEEYKHVLGEAQPNRRNQKHGKSLNTEKLPSPRKLSVTTKARRVSKKVNQKEKIQSSSEQNNSLEIEESFDVEMRDDADLSAEESIVNTPKSAGSAGERVRPKNKRKKEDKVDESAFNSVCDSSSGEQATSKMEFSEGESVATKESVTVLSQEKSFEKKKANQEAGIDSVDSKTDNMETDSKNDDESLRSGNKTTLKSCDVYDKKSAVGKKIGRKRKGFSKISSASEEEILDTIHPKERGNSALERNNSICEPVDMSISEDCSGTEKIRYLSKSAPSDSEVSESLAENHKNLAQEVSITNRKTKLLKKDKLSVNQGAQKSSEVSSATSSSYNSGYEITPSKSLVVSKEQSLSTKTTDSGITGMVDSNPYCDSDSCTSDKQQTLDGTQKLISYPDNITKEEQHNISGKSSVINSSGSIVKTSSLLPHEGIPSCSGGKTSEIRPPFLLRMRPTMNEEPVDSDSDAESRKAIMLSAQRRIEQNLSTTDSEGRRFSSHQTPTSSLPDAEDSDDAPPESMTFEAGRNTATESLRDAVESIRRDRQRRKEKRRARLEKLRQQKEEKLIRLKERLASQEDASCSSSEESGYEDEEVRHYKKKPLSREKAKSEKEISERTTKSKKKSSNTEGRVAKTKEMDSGTQEDHHTGISNGLTKRLPDELLERLSEKAPTTMKVTLSEKTEENGINNNVTSIQKKRKKVVLPSSEQSDEPSDSQSFKKPTTLDYIPLKSSASTKFGIMSYDKVVNVSKSAAQKAAEFRQNMMFGNRHKREPANSGLIYQQKIKASGKDVFARKKY